MSNYATIMTEYISQYVKTIVHDTRNRVNDDMKCVGKGLRQKPKERVRKQRARLIPRELLSETT